MAIKQKDFEVVVELSQALLDYYFLREAQEGNAATGLAGMISVGRLREATKMVRQMTHRRKKLMGETEEVDLENPPDMTEEAIAQWVGNVSKDEGVYEAFIDLHDMLREAAEESSMNLTIRKRLVRETIRKMSNETW